MNGNRALRKVWWRQSELMRGNILMKRFSTILFFFVFGCVSGTAQVRNAISGQEIRKADLKDAAYRYVIDNLAEDEEGLEITKNDINGFSVEKSFGNLTGDLKEEAAVLVSYYVGGTGASGRHKILVYSLENKNLTLLGKIEGGDRAFGGLKSAKILNRRLKVQTFVPNADECAVCYAGVAETSYEYISGDFVNVHYAYIADMAQKTNPKTGVTYWVYTPPNSHRLTKKKRK